MSVVRQSAGKCEIEVFTDGSPVWPHLRITRRNGEKIDVGLRVDDLHDLRYCIERVLQHLEGR